MSKYDVLANELKRRRDSSVQMTFTQVEALVGPLPPSACTHAAWWGNHAGNSQAGRGWMAADRLVEQLDMEGQTVCFRLTDTPGIAATRAEPVERSPEGGQSLARLRSIGFELVGRWAANEAGLQLELGQHGDRQPALYAFVVGSEVKYVGKTATALRTRMAHYRNPDPTQSTNIRCNGLIRQALDSGDRIEIHAFFDTGLWAFGGFHLNLAAGMEDDIIAQLKPEWNWRA